MEYKLSLLNSVYKYKGGILLKFEYVTTPVLVDSQQECSCHRFGVFFALIVTPSLMSSSAPLFSGGFQWPYRCLFHVAFHWFASRLYLFWILPSPRFLETRRVITVIKKIFRFSNIPILKLLTCKYFLLLSQVKIFPGKFCNMCVSLSKEWFLRKILPEIL